MSLVPVFNSQFHSDTTNKQLEPMTVAETKESKKKKFFGTIIEVENSRHPDESEDDALPLRETKNEAGDSVPLSPSKETKSVSSPKKQKRSVSESETSEVETSNHSPIVIPRVEIRAMVEEGKKMLDGCRWRKYGQKTSRLNPNPKAYHKCSMTKDCPARKQVQRDKDDVRILASTYVENHNHRLPPEALPLDSAIARARTSFVEGTMQEYSNEYPILILDLTNGANTHLLRTS